MKKILLSLFGIITLGLINFSSAGSYTYSGTLDLPNGISSIAYLFRLPVPFNSIPYSSTIYLSCDFSFNNFQSSDLTNFAYIGRFSSINLSNFINSNLVIGNSEILLSLNNYSFSKSINSNTFSNNLVSAFELYRYSSSSSLSCSSSDGCSIDYSCTFEGDYIINQADIGGGSSNCTQCESDLSSCQSSLSGANSDLSTCQLTLSGYVNTLDNLSNNLQTCNSSLNACLQANCPDVEVPDVQWSAFWVNNTQIQGAPNIYLYLPDFLNWDYTYIDNGSTLEIDVENEGDQEYINNILDIQSYHPDKDQFAMSFAGFLTLLMPYIIITLFIIFVWKLIRRIFR